MFHTWRDKTLRDGTRGQGTVVDALQEVLYLRMSPANQPFEYKRTIRVTFADGSTSEVEDTILLRNVQRLADRRTIDCWSQVVERTKPGATVPVRYDESDHSHIVLDIPALVKGILASGDRSGNT